MASSFDYNCVISLLTLHSLCYIACCFIAKTTALPTFPDYISKSPVDKEGITTGVPNAISINSVTPKEDNGPPGEIPPRNNLALSPGLESDTYQSTVTPKGQNSHECPLLCRCDLRNSALDNVIKGPIDQWRVFNQTRDNGNDMRLQTVDCSDTGLKQLPSVIPMDTQLLKLTSNRIDIEAAYNSRLLETLPQLRELDLENNHIYCVLHLDARLPSLSALSLARNQIDYLANSTFWGMSNLRYFSVADNKIEVVHRDTFVSLPKLETLIMSANRISEIDVRWFRNLPRLIKLDLSANNIHTLPDWPFTYLSRLVTLDLRSNQIRSVHHHAFDGLANLQYLYLQDNSLTLVPTLALQVFSGTPMMGALQEIDLNANHFQTLSPGSFDSVNAVTLRLNRCKWLTLVDRGAFRNMSQLQTLEMSGNKELVYIDREAFQNVPRLSRLLLSNNALSTLEESIWESLPSLEVLDLHLNPLYCDCTLRWVTDLATSQMGSMGQSMQNMTVKTINNDNYTANKTIKDMENMTEKEGSATKYVNAGKSPLSLTPNNGVLEATAKSPPPPRKSNLSLLNAIHTQCQLPVAAAAEKGPTSLPTFIAVFLNDTDKLKSIPESPCLPRLMPLFAPVYNKSIGDSISLACKAIAVPIPKVRWILPVNHEHSLDKTLTSSLATITSSDVLNKQGDEIGIEFVLNKHGGDYTCIAENSIGTGSKITTVNVQTQNTHVIVELITSHTITITWANTHHSRQYEVIYYPSKTTPNFTYHTVVIQPYMRSYTISKLRASHKYDICIAVKYRDKDIPIHCSTVATRDASYDAEAVQDTRNYVITVSIIILISVILLTCLISFLSKRYNRRREREAKLYSDSLSQLCPNSPTDSISDTTPMTYENRLAEMGLLDLEETDEGEIHASTSLASIPSTSA